MNLSVKTSRSEYEYSMTIYDEDIVDSQAAKLILIISITELPGNCGIILLHTLMLGRVYKRNREKYHKPCHDEIINFIKTIRNFEYMVALKGKVIATDHLEGDMQDFVLANGWKQIGVPCNNANSGNYITLYELNLTSEKEVVKEKVTAPSLD